MPSFWAETMRFGTNAQNTKCLTTIGKASCLNWKSKLVQKCSSITILPIRNNMLIWYSPIDPWRSWRCIATWGIWYHYWRTTSTTILRSLPFTQRNSTTLKLSICWMRSPIQRDSLFCSSTCRTISMCIMFFRCYWRTSFFAIAMASKWKFMIRVTSKSWMW